MAGAKRRQIRHEWPQPAATRRRAQTWAAGGCVAAGRSEAEGSGISRQSRLPRGRRRSRKGHDSLRSEAEHPEGGRRFYRPLKRQTITVKVPDGLA